MTEIVLAVQDISKKFGALAASRNVSFDLRRGEIHALIGPNGAGKSTLVKQIAGEITPDSGHILLSGERIDRLDAVQRARLGLARSFQISCLAMELSVLKNVMAAVQSKEGRVFRFLRPVNGDGGLVQAAIRHLAAVGIPDTRRAGDNVKRGHVCRLEHDLAA